MRTPRELPIRTSLVLTPQVTRERLSGHCAERRPRQGWGEAFRAAGPGAHDELLLGSAEPNEFDRKEWQW